MVLYYSYFITLIQKRIIYINSDSLCMYKYSNNMNYEVKSFSIHIINYFPIHSYEIDIFH